MYKTSENIGIRDIGETFLPRLFNYLDTNGDSLIKAIYLFFFDLLMLLLIQFPIHICILLRHGFRFSLSLFGFEVNLSLEDCIFGLPVSIIILPMLFVSILSYFLI